MCHEQHELCRSGSVPSRKVSFKCYSQNSSLNIYKSTCYILKFVTILVNKSTVFWCESVKNMVTD
jgi:hypothetical protein